MKKIISIILLFTLVFCVSAQSSKKETKEINQTVNLAVMQGPTGFSSAMLEDYIKVFVFPSPNETVAKLVNGELDMAVLPANTAANLYNKGIRIKVAAIVGEGMLSVVGNGNEETQINVPGAGGTPDHMATLLYPEYGRNYSISAPAQLAQMLIAEKVHMAILPQPFVSMVLRKNQNIKIIDDVQKRWKKSTGFAKYPMSVLVVTEKFVSEKPNLAEKVISDYKKSIDKVLANPHEAAQIIEQKGIMKAELAEPAIKDCAIVFEKGTSAQKELISYYNVLLQLAPEAIGGKAPDSGLFR